MGFPGGSAGEESTCDAGDLGLIPGLGKYPGGGEGYPLQYSGLEYLMECIAYGVTKCWMQLSKYNTFIENLLCYELGTGLDIS